MDWVDLLLLTIYTFHVSAPMVRDELALRLLLLLTSIGFGAWGWLSDLPITVVANCLFTALSLRHIFRLLRQRQPVELTSEQVVVYEQLFSAMSERQFLELWNLGVPGTAPVGNLIVRGELVDDVIVVIDQAVHIELDTGDRVAASPSVLGEMSYALGESAVATATVRVETPAQIRRWTKETLRGLGTSHSALEVPFLAAMGANLARKIRL